MQRIQRRLDRRAGWCAVLLGIGRHEPGARDGLAFVTLPAYSPELNPTEECWRQLQDALSNGFFDSLEQLTTAIDTALDQLSLPNVSDYF